MTEHNPYGRDELMVIAAVRYCLGRQTYIVSDCATWLIANWERFAPGTRKLIQRDIEKAFAEDDRLFSIGYHYRPLGMDCDGADWVRVRKLWNVDADLQAVSDTSEQLGGY